MTELTLDQVLWQSCQQHAQRVAMREKLGDTWEAVTYGQMAQKARRIAAGILHHGIEPGSHIALLAPPGSSWVTTYFGILAAGCVVVPVDKDLKKAELAHVIRDSEACLIFCTESYLETVLEARHEVDCLQSVVLIQSQMRPRQQEEAAAALEKLVGQWQQLVQEFQLPEERIRDLEDRANSVLQLLTSQEQTPAHNKKSKHLFSLRRKLYQKISSGEPVHYLEAFSVDQELPPTQRRPADAAMLLYTSGTTGRAKGAVLSHANITSNIAEIVTLFGLDEHTHTLSFLPINHVFEQVPGILLPLAIGGSISFAQSIKKLGENLAEIQPTFFLGVPAVYRMFYDRLRKQLTRSPLTRSLAALPGAKFFLAAKVRARLGAKTIFVSGGAALDKEVARGLRQWGINLYQGYGITETSPVIAVERLDAQQEGTVGLPLPSVEVAIHHPNKDGVGEIWVKGPNVMQGYYRSPEASAEVLTDGWYHTGDMGYVDPRGFLTICGRVKNLIVTPNGKNVYPEEVEQEILKSVYIQEVMVYGHKLSASSEEVHASIYPDHEALDQYALDHGQRHLSQSQIESLLREEVQQCGRQLADYKRVKKFTVREDEFPKTTTRKIKRFAVEAQIEAESGSE